jgi:hypothetical protein
LEKSLQKSIDIKLISSKDVYSDYVPFIKQREEISIFGSGSYKSILELIQYLDSFNALLKITDIKVFIEEKSITSFEIKISHYGVEL